MNHHCYRILFNKTLGLMVANLEKHSQYSGKGIGVNVNASLSKQTNQAQDSKQANSKSQYSKEQSVGYGKDGDGESSTTRGGINTSNVVISDKAQQAHIAKAEGKMLEQSISEAKVTTTTAEWERKGGRDSQALENRFDEQAVRQEIGTQISVVQQFNANQKEFTQQQNEKAEQARLAGDKDQAKDIEQQAKLINVGLGLLSLGVGGNMPTEYKLIQGVDNISTGYESFKDSLNNSDNLNLNLDILNPHSHITQYIQTEMGKYEYCQGKSNPKACMNQIDNINSIDMAVPKPSIPRLGVISVSISADTTSILPLSKGGAFSSYLNIDGENSTKGESYTISDTYGFGASFGLGIDWYKNINVYQGKSETNEVCFLVMCGRNHQDPVTKESIGWGLSPLSEVGGGFTHHKGNTKLIDKTGRSKKK